MGVNASDKIFPLSIFEMSVVPGFQVEENIDGLVFSSQFDSGACVVRPVFFCQSPTPAFCQSATPTFVCVSVAGNMARVEKVAADDGAEEIQVWTTPDCGASEFQTDYTYVTCWRTGTG